MNGVELLEQVYLRREAGEATACQTCVTKCLSDKLDSGDKASDQDQAICFSECGCSKEGTEFSIDDIEIARKWNGAGEAQRQKMLQRGGHSGVGSDGGPPLVKMSFDRLPRSVQEDVIEFDIAGEGIATEQDIISKCKICGFSGGMKDIIKHSDDTGHDDIELMGATKEVLLIEEADNHKCRTTPDGLDCLCPDCDTDADQFNNMSCKACKRSKGFENCGCKFNKYAGESLKRLEKKHGKEVAFMFGKITAIEGKKIKGTLAYAGVSHNNRLYLPEELQKGDEMNLPMIFNHASPDGAEFELSRLPNEIRESILNHEHIRVGEVKLHWDPENLTLFYEGEVNDEFFASEIDQGLMSVSLGMLFDADSPEICDQECYTAVKGAEFTEVSLVYHPGFPIATIESNEKRLKKRITPRQYKI